VRGDATAAVRAQLSGNIVYSHISHVAYGYGSSQVRPNGTYLVIYTALYPKRP
jgi:hypothetical protein